MNENTLIEEMVESAQVTVMKGNPYKFFEFDGRMFCCGILDAYATYGIPVSASISMCQEKGIVPAIDQFRIDARLAGWSKEKIICAIND